MSWQKDIAAHYWFVSNLIDYVIFRNKMTPEGTGLTRSDFEKKLMNARFQLFMGDAIYKYYESHGFELFNLVAVEFWTIGLGGIKQEILNKYFNDAANKIFEENNFLKEYFVYNAFLVYMVQYFGTSGHVTKVQMIGESMDPVYKKHLIGRFPALGGWNELNKYVIRCHAYSEIKP